MGKLTKIGEVEMALTGLTIERKSPNTFMFSEKVPMGTYRAKLMSIDICEIDDFNDPLVKHPGLCFFYELQVPSASKPVTCERKVKRIFSTDGPGRKSALTVDLIQMIGKPNYLKLINLPDDKVAKNLEKLIGREYMISVLVNEKDFNKFGGLSKVPDEPASTQQKSAEPEASTQLNIESGDDDIDIDNVDFDDDDIPF